MHLLLRETSNASLTRNVVSSVDEMPTADGNGMHGRIRCTSGIHLKYKNQNSISLRHKRYKMYKCMRAKNGNPYEFLCCNRISYSINTITDVCCAMYKI